MMRRNEGELICRTPLRARIRSALLIMPESNEIPVALHALENETIVACLSAALLLAFFLSAYGWGKLLREWLSLPLLRLTSVSMVAGMALLNVIGGWLNVFK